MFRSENKNLEVLVAPYWNVNELHFNQRASWSDVLVAPYWNVNKFS